MDQQQQIIIPSPSWNSNDWSYIAEGGKHAIFRYSGIDCNFSGHVLRIAKSDLARASSFHAENDGRKSASSSSTSSRTSNVIESMEESTTQTFQRKIVQPLLGHCYLDLARLVRLPASCCAQLHHRTLVSNSIPPSRLPSWKHDDTKDGAVEPISHEWVMAALLHDHTHLSRHPLSPISNNIIDDKPTVLSVEIKPKAGYITSSPLVLPSHRCKYYRTRYSLQQELMKKGHIQKGWRRMKKAEDAQHSTANSNTIPDAFTPSNYSPLDLFSDNPIQIQKALEDLSHNMQNNFRVWCNGRQIFGEYEAPTENDCRKILNEFFLHTENNTREQLSDPKSSLIDAITRTVSEVLDRESLLSNILSMQQLDVIDDDGAVEIYERLVHLCDGSHSEAEKLLDQAALIPSNGLAAEMIGDKNDLISASPYIFPVCNSLDKLLGETSKFQKYFLGCVLERSGPKEDIMNATHITCIECVNHLSKEACIYLLQNWLLSLALCDVSVFVTFQLLTDQEHKSVEECQSCDLGGVALLSLQTDALAPAPSMAVHYEVKVVDCDPKPAKKLRGRGEVESKFQFITI
mmetsp:Transcript_21414/g.46513  ORF Transcript_21414/g.46513 Transcript_21414/m.46513 type:complete len:574 (+) Transcript_21414:2-1723(+)